MLLSLVPLFGGRADLALGESMQPGTQLLLVVGEAEVGRFGHRGLQERPNTSAALSFMISGTTSGFMSSSEKLVIHRSGEMTG